MTPTAIHYKGSLALDGLRKRLSVLSKAFHRRTRLLKEAYEQLKQLTTPEAISLVKELEVEMEHGT